MFKSKDEEAEDKKPLASDDPGTGKYWSVVCMCFKLPIGGFSCVQSIII